MTDENKPPSEASTEEIARVATSVARARNFSEHAAGCCLHVVTDDLNLDDQSVTFAALLASTKHHGSCEAAARALLTLVEDDRRFALALSDLMVRTTHAGFARCAICGTTRRGRWCAACDVAMARIEA